MMTSRFSILVGLVIACMAVAVDADQKESTRMVDDQAADPVALAQSNRKQGGEAAGATVDSAACSVISIEADCALRNGCAWCLSTASPPARRLLDDGDGEDVSKCSVWTECTGPPAVCELRTTGSACSGDAATESSCVWCKSEGRCVNMSAKGLEASKNAQCKGCDGAFDSGLNFDKCGVCEGKNSTCLSGHSFTFTRHEKMGIALALSGNILISISLNTQKYAHNKNEERGAGKVSYVKLKLWWVGMLLMAVGETGNFLAYAYAPATIVAPLGAVSVVSNCFLASFILKEHIGMRNILGLSVSLSLARARALSLTYMHTYTCNQHQILTNTYIQCIH